MNILRSILIFFFSINFYFFLLSWFFSCIHHFPNNKHLCRIRCLNIIRHPIPMICLSVLNKRRHKVSCCCFLFSLNIFPCRSVYTIRLFAKVNHDKFLMRSWAFFFPFAIFYRCNCRICEQRAAFRLQKFNWKPKRFKSDWHFWTASQYGRYGLPKKITNPRRYLQIEFEVCVCFSSSIFAKNIIECYSIAVIIH